MCRPFLDDQVLFVKNSADNAGARQKPDDGVIAARGSHSRGGDGAAVRAEKMQTALRVGGGPFALSPIFYCRRRSRLAELLLPPRLGAA